MDWLNRTGESAPPLAVFVDGKKAAWLNEEPFFDQLGSQRLYAYLREPASRSFFVACPQAAPCDQVDIIRDDAPARLALAWELRGVATPQVARMGIELLLVGWLAWCVSTRLPGWFVAALLALEAGLAMLTPNAAGTDTALRSVMAAVSGLAVAPLVSGLKRATAWGRRVIALPPRTAPLAKVSIFALVAWASAWPGVRTVPGWYPDSTDDSHFYLFAASRFLRTDDLFHAAMQPENWRYSAYPLILAAFSRILGLHPMEAYAWVSGLGAIALVSAAGALAWIATGRLTTGLLTTWISGTWGGLGGWVWLMDRGASWFTTGALRLLETDYHQPLFLGEFTGPYSELTTYITSAPFYPREAGLVPFWIGLGFLYRRLKPAARPPSLAVICALFLISTAIYPYYGITAPVALLVVAIAEGRGDETLRRRRRRTLGAAALVAIVAVVVGDFASQAYRGFSAWEWVSAFLVSAPVALAADNEKPSLDFLATRILGGEFFVLLAFASAVGLGFRPKDSLSEPQRRAALVTVAICFAHGTLSQVSQYSHLLFFNFRWFVSWRALLTPIAALGAALFVERAMIRWTARPTVTSAALVLVPALSGLLWSYSVTDFLTSEKEKATDRGGMARLWSDYQGYGRDVLGHTGIPEPLAIERATRGERAVASAAFGIGVIEAPELFNNHAALLPASLGDRAFASSVALAKDSPSAVRLRSTGCCTVITSYGKYDVYVRRSAQNQH